MGNQNPPPNLTVLKGGTIVHSVVAIDLTGAGVTLSGDGRTAFVTITGGGAQEWQAGTVTDLGANLSLIGGTLAATGGGGGSYVGNPTLGVTIVGSGPGTILSTGTIKQPAATGTVQPNGIYLRGGNGISTTPNHTAGGVNIYGGDMTSPGTTNPEALSGGFLGIGGTLTLTDAAGYGSANEMYFRGGNATNTALGGFNLANGAGVIMNGGSMAGSTVALGGSAYIYGGSGGLKGGGVTLHAGAAFSGLPGQILLDTYPGGASYAIISNAGTTSTISGALYAEALTGIVHRKP